MGLTGKNVEKHIVAKGDFAMKAAGSDLYTVNSNGKVSWNISPGQLVAFRLSGGTPTVVDDGTLAAGDLPNLFIGVGWDGNGDGVADDIRYVGIDKVAGCNIVEASTSSPKCGQPEIVDFYFDCTKNDQVYSLMVRVDDNRTRSYAPFNKSYEEIVSSVITGADVCEDCSPEHKGGEIACKLADGLNADVDLKIGDELYPDWKGKNLPRPIYATRLHDRSLVYCLSPSAENPDCDTCNYVGAINEITVNSVLVSLTNTVDPNNASNTLIGQLELVADQINEAFDDAFGPHSGRAWVSGSTGSECCPIQLHVNTCDATFAITGLAATTDENPFTEYGTFTKDADCADCDGDNASTFTPTHGVRVFSQPIKPDRNPYLTKPLAFYGRKIDVLPYGEGWKSGYTRTVKVQSLELPGQFGSMIQYLEYRNQDIGGKARKSSHSNNNQGWLNLPGNRSRVLNLVTAEWNKDYCSYYMRLKPYINPFDGGRKTTITVNSTIHVPSNDSTTIASWEAFWTALLGLVPGCDVDLTAVNCSTDYSSC